jgi:hypothetical protein
MEPNEILLEQILEIIENQIQDNNPKETNLNLKRLIELGYTDTEAKQLIVQCLTIELFDVIKLDKSFNELRYITNLEKLPKEPNT